MWLTRVGVSTSGSSSSEMKLGAGSGALGRGAAVALVAAAATDGDGNADPLAMGSYAGAATAVAGAGGGGALARDGATVRVPAWLRRSFTFAIRVWGSNGLARNPSHPTRLARSWSKGSNAPVRSRTGMCASEGVFLMKSHTS